MTDHITLPHKIHARRTDGKLALVSESKVRLSSRMVRKLKRLLIQGSEEFDSKVQLTFDPVQSHAGATPDRVKGTAVD